MYAAECHRGHPGRSGKLWELTGIVSRERY
jgi:hypothetical protein